MLQRSSARQSLEQQVQQLCQLCEPADAQVLSSQADSCLQPQREALQMATLQLDCLQMLAGFLQTHGEVAGVLRGLRQTVESAGSWDCARVVELQQELAAAVPDIQQLEAAAAGLDSSLCKAHLHLSSDDGSCKSSRMLADSLGTDLDLLRNLLGTKQNQAEALGVLWTSFRQRRDQLLRAVEDIEERADQQPLKEASLHALQLR